VRRLLAHLGILVVSVCATLTLLEIGIRIVKPQDLEYWDSQSIHRILGTTPHFVENIPHGHANFVGVPVTINSYGLRGGEISRPKPPNTVRIVVVGDSITFGYGIPVESTYAKVLEKRLNINAPGKTQYEVLNGGTIGGSLSDYYHFLSEKTELLQPDMILVGLALNDILVYSESGSISEAGAQWHGRRLPWTRKFSRFLLRHSQLYLFCYVRLKSAMYASGIIDVNKVRGLDFVTLTPPSAYQKEAWESSFRMLAKIAAFCRGRGYRFGVVVFPMQMQLSAEELRLYRDRYHLRLGDGALSGEPQQRLREFAAITGVTIVDLLPVYRAYRPEELYLRNAMIPSDPSHPSVKGNQVAADEIFRVFKPSLIDSISTRTEAHTKNSEPGSGERGHEFPVAP
jgi:lysophospholipase L1-like esterase